jgi:lipoprotein signal peptidase
MADQRSPYWFRAKTYGWGWGLPARREGWIVMVSWIIILTLAGLFIAPRSILAFCLFAFVMGAVLFAICYAKGEPPRWRWGKSQR